MAIKHLWWRHCVMVIGDVGDRDGGATRPEREALAAVLEVGLVDLDARRWGPRERRCTWWNHGRNYSRNLGMRIDLLAADPSLAARLITTWIDHLERGEERPSDHAA